MTYIRINWKIMIGWIATLGSIIALFSTMLDQGAPKKHTAADAKKKMSANRDSKPSFANQPIKSHQREPILHLDIPSTNHHDIRLRHLLAAGDLNAVHDAMQTLAENHQLAEIAELLQVWCRDGSIELVQWSLALSSETDPKLNLALEAEALSNPSEAIREIATSELESASGIRFSGSKQARAWLASQVNQ